MSARITFTGIEGVQQTLANIPAFERRVMDDMAEIAYASMRAGAGRHSPRLQGTGRLFASMYREGTGSLRQVVGHDLNTAPHAEFVIFPTIPHWIVPKKPGGWLAWRTNGGGGPWTFRKRVWHPGYAGDNYRDPAMNDALSQMARIVDDNIRSI